MKVKELMSTELITVSPNNKLEKVFFLYNFENIRHLSVLEKNKLVSIFSDRDLKKILGPKKLSSKTPVGLTPSSQSAKLKT